MKKPTLPIYLRCSVLALLVFSSFNHAFAQTEIWSNGTSGYWFSATNWSDGSVPTTGQDVRISNSGTAIFGNAPTGTAGATIGSLVVGNASGERGTFVISDPANDHAILTSGTSFIGYQNGSQGTVILNKSNGEWKVSQLYVGYQGTGTLSISNGAKVTPTVPSTIYVGYRPTGAGTINVSGSATLWKSTSNPLQLVIGEEGFGSLNISSNAKVEASSVTLGSHGGNGTLTVSDGGSLTIPSASLKIVSGGTINIGDYAGGTTSGTIQANSIDLGSSSAARLNFNQTNQNTLSLAITGNGGIEQRGTGTTVLTGTNSYIGTTTVSQGLLYIDGNQSTAYGITSVSANGTLAGSGTLGGTILVSGTLNPGHGVGSTRITTFLSLQSGSRLVMQLAGPGSYDQLQASSISVDSSATLEIQLIGYIPVEGDTFTLFTQALPSFSSEQIVLPTLTDGLYWNTENISTTGQLSVVPEPQTIFLAGIGVGLLIWRLRKKSGCAI